MQQDPYLDQFIQECVQEYSATTPADDRIATEAIVSLLTVLVYEGFKIMLPELKEWLKLGAVKITMKRQEIEKKLMAYAEQKELDYEAAKKAAGIITGRISEKNVENIVKALS